jgi:hypothetical protein
VLIDHTSRPVTSTVPLSGASNPPAIWSGHDDEFACVQSEVKVRENVHLLVAPAVRLVDAFELQYRLNAWVAAVPMSARRASVSNFWRL